MRKLAAIVWCLAGCFEQTRSEPPPDQMSMPPAPNLPKLDILFVVDNSGSTLDKQQALEASFPTLVTQLTGFDRGLPDLHIGFVTTTVALGEHDGLDDNCAFAPLDDGLLHDGPTGECLTPNGRYLIDEVKSGGTRYANYTGSLDDAIACMAPVGELACGYEAPLEAMKRALDGSHPENAGFLRDDANLAIVIVTDEDDSSFADLSLLDAPVAAVGAADFRAQPEYAYDCIPPITADAPGTYSNCSIVTGSYLQDPAYYAAFLAHLKPASQLAVTVIAGPETSTIATGAITEPFQQALALLPSCVTDGSSSLSIARPGLRLAAFRSLLGDAATFDSICTTDDSNAMASMIDIVRTELHQ